VSLTAKDVAEITRLLEESSFDELYLEVDGLKLSLKRGSTAQSESRPGLPAANASTTAPAAQVPAIAIDSSVHSVSAPLLGTFYRAPKPGAQPFVEVGSQVERDSIIGIIEVMKLMNTVRADVRGTVIEILAQDGALVEYGQVLLRIGKAS
jgi:acetyl-CoA carboxylase biotin carboxyl carrier protein